MTVPHRQQENEETIVVFYSSVVKIFRVINLVVSGIKCVSGASTVKYLEAATS
jgi:hypothetical protein